MLEVQAVAQPLQDLYFIHRLENNFPTQSSCPEMKAEQHYITQRWKFLINKPQTMGEVFQDG